MAGPRGLALVLELAGTATVGSAATIAAAAALRPEIARCASWGGDFDRGYRQLITRSKAHRQQGIVYLEHDGEVKSLVTVFAPYNLLTAAVKSLALHFALLWNKYMLMVDTANEEAELLGRDQETVVWPDFPWDEIPPTLRASCFAFLRDISTLSVRRVYERIAASNCSPRTTHKLLKDIKTSAVRKAMTYPRLQRIPRVFKTAMRGMALGSLAEFTVSSAIDVYMMLFRHMPGHPVPKRLPERLARRILANAMRSASSLLIASAATAVGSAATKRGLLIITFATVADLGIQLVLISPPLERFAAGEPMFGPPRPPRAPPTLPHGHYHPHGTWPALTPEQVQAVPNAGLESDADQTHVGGDAAQACSEGAHVASPALGTSWDAFEEDTATQQRGQQGHVDETTWDPADASAPSLDPF